MAPVAPGRLDWTGIPCIARQILNHWATREPFCIAFENWLSGRTPLVIQWLGLCPFKAGAAHLILAEGNWIPPALQWPKKTQKTGVSVGNVTSLSSCCLLEDIYRPFKVSPWDFMWILLLLRVLPFFQSILLLLLLLSRFSRVRLCATP